MKKKVSVLIAVLVLLSLLLAACGQTQEVETAAEEPAAEEAAPQEAAAEEAVVEEEAVAEEAPAEEAAPAEENAEPVVVKYWHTMDDAEAEQLKAVIAAFEAQNPGVTVEATKYAYDDFKSALLTSLAGGEAPDVARLDIAWVSEFADQGALLALDSEMADFAEIAANTFAGPLSTNYWDGAYYGLPQDTNTQVLLWNSDVFAAAGIESAPTTMEEFVDTACALSDAANEKYGYALGGTYFWAPAPIFYTMGGQIVDEDFTTASGYVNSPESVAAFTLLTEMYNDGCISPNLLGGGVGTSDGLATGMYAMIVDGPWMQNIYAEQYPDFQVNFEMMPSENGFSSSVVGGQDVVVFYDTDVKDAALAWTSYLLSEEAQLMMAQAGVIPTLSSLVGNETLPAYFATFMVQLETAQARVPHPAWSEMDNAINNAFQRMLNGDQTPQEALDKAAAEIDALLN